MSKSAQMRIARVAILVATTTLALTGCDNNSPLETNSQEAIAGANSPATAPTTDTAVRLYLSSEGAEPEFQLPDGTQGQGWSDYAVAVQAYVLGTSSQPITVEFTDTPILANASNSTTSAGNGIEVSTDPLFVKIPFTNYGARVDFYASKYVGACVAKTGPAANFQFSRLGVNPPIVDMHIIAYAANGRPCVGLYNSGSYGWFCKNICGPKYSDIRSAVYAAVIATGVTATIASVVTDAVTPVVVSGLALAL